MVSECCGLTQINAFKTERKIVVVNMREELILMNACFAQGLVPVISKKILLV